MRRVVSDDTEALDWLETFGGSVEHDEVMNLWTVHPRERGYPRGVGPTLRAAAAQAMRGARAVDARPSVPFAR